MNHMKGLAQNIDVCSGKGFRRNQEGKTGSSVLFALFQSKQGLIMECQLSWLTMELFILSFTYWKSSTLTELFTEAFYNVFNPLKIVFPA